MSTASISSLAVSTRSRGYCTDPTVAKGRSIECQGDAGWGVATRDKRMVMFMVAPFHWEARPRKRR